MNPEVVGSFGNFDVDLSLAEGRAFVDHLIDIEPNRLTPDFRDAIYQHTGGHKSETHGQEFDELRLGSA